MKKLLMLLGILAAGAVAAQVTNFTRSSTSQATTSSAPTDAGQGLSLTNLQGWRLSVCLAAQVTNPDGGADLTPAARLTGDGGTMQAYLFDSDQGAWQRNPDLDETVTSTNVTCAGSACRCQVWADRPVSVPQGRVYYTARGVRIEHTDGGGGAIADDGGTLLNVQIKGITRTR